MQMIMSRAGRAQSAFAAAILLGAFAGSMKGAMAIPSLSDHMMPVSIVKLTATGRTVWADQAQLAKINAEYGDAYRVHEATYSYSTPDRLEYKTQVGPTTVTLVTTNTYRLIQVRSGLLRKDYKLDISGDVTKRQTLFALGVLPKNYIDTVHAEFIGRESIMGVNCEVFQLRFVDQKPDNPQHWRIWVDSERHYVVQKKLWSDTNERRETIVYLKPQRLGNGFWMPTRAECYNPEGKLAGVVEYVDISAS
ncbi:MAG: hypothetical protein P4L33_01720 [Capsulimonadaceae bacterium]|nr:hypothetical protein [Capsulimonadaceae bacterium]